MTDIINEEENENEIPEEQEEEVVVDNGTTYESTESAIIAKEEADKAKLWAQESERQAGLAAGSATTAVEARDDAIEAKEYAEAAITDTNLIVVATDLQATPSNIKTVATNISNVNTVAGISTDVTAVAGNAANISAVAGNSTNINAVAGNSSNINAVAGNASNINAVAGNATNINAVNANKTNIDTVAGIDSDVAAVASISSNVTAVAGNATNINDVASNATNINAVAGDIANINAVAADLANINSASTYADNANIWAEGTDAQVQALGGVHSSKGWAEQSSQGQVQADWAEADSTEKSYIKNKPTNLVTTDTAQTITGFKTFSNYGLSSDSAQIDVVCENLDLNNLPSSDVWSGIEFRDANGTRVAKVEPTLQPDGTMLLQLSVSRPVNGTMKYGTLAICVKPDGTVYSRAPTPDSSDNTTKIATTAFVKSVLSSSGNGLATISKSGNGYCQFTNGLLIQWGRGNGTISSNKMTITFPKSFSSASSYAVTTNITYSSTTASGWANIVSCTATNFVSTVDSNGKPKHWLAIGY